MGYIKEPDGVDFVIKSRPLTKGEEIAVSEYISAYKAKHAQNKLPVKKARKAAPSKRETTAKKKVIV